MTPLRMGIVGFGRMGMHHADRARRREDYELTAVCDVSAAQRELARAAYSCRTYDSLEGLLADPAVEVVFLCTPPAGHARLAVQTLRADKHVVVETPMCRTEAHAREMIAVAQRAQRTLTVAQTRRWDEHFRTAQQIVQSGKLGDLRAIKLIAWRYSPPRVESRESRAESGVMDAGLWTLESLAAHYFDQLLLLAGRPAADVYAAMADGEGYLETTPSPLVGEGRGGGAPETTLSPLEGAGAGQAVLAPFLSVIRFEGGLTAHVELNLTSLVPLSTGWIISGSDGGFSDFKFYTEDRGEVVETPVPRVPADWDLWYDALYRHLRLGEPLPVTPQEAVEVVRLIEAARRSSATRKVTPLA